MANPVPQQQLNFINNLIEVSNQIAGTGPVSVPNFGSSPAIFGLSNEINLLVAEWNAHSWATTMVDADIQAAMPWLSLAKITNAVTAIEAVQNALGNNVNGQLLNLILMIP